MVKVGRARRSLITRPTSTGELFIECKAKRLRFDAKFSQIIDDGEAQAIALAKNRNMLLLTDDRKARKLAQRADVDVATISTVDVLREWVGQVGVDQATLRGILGRIQELAKFIPPKNSTDLAWWVAQFASDQA